MFSRRSVLLVRNCTLFSSLFSLIQCIVYDIDQQKIVFQVPVWDEALHVAVRGCGQFALVSYAASPPELWRIEKLGNGKISLKLWHMYLPESNEGNAPVFAGKARFG